MNSAPLLFACRPIRALIYLMKGTVLILRSPLVKRMAGLGGSSSIFCTTGHCSVTSERCYQGRRFTKVRSQQRSAEGSERCAREKSPDSWAQPNSQRDRHGQRWIARDDSWRAWAELLHLRLRPPRPTRKIYIRAAVFMASKFHAFDSPSFLNSRSAVLKFGEAIPLPIRPSTKDLKSFPTPSLVGPNSPLRNSPNIPCSSTTSMERQTTLIMAGAVTWSTAPVSFCFVGCGRCFMSVCVSLS